MKSKLIKALPVTLFIIGLLIVMYPEMSNYINTKDQKKEIEEYNDILNNTNYYLEDKMLKEAREYNKQLLDLNYPLIEYKKLNNYENILNINNRGMIGYITIKKIGVNLPIYHGSSEDVLSNSVGHLEGSSFPIGGINTHSVFSAHRGLPSSKLFTDLNKLELGDTFEISIFNNILTYQVDQIKTVLPEEVNDLKVIDNRDLVTLITCTPYGINTHRLLVRGTRIDNITEQNNYIVSDAYQINKFSVSLALSIPIFVFLIIFLPKRKGGIYAKNYK